MNYRLQTHHKDGWIDRHTVDAKHAPEAVRIGRKLLGNRVPVRAVCLSQSDYRPNEGLETPINCPTDFNPTAYQAGNRPVDTSSNIPSGLLGKNATPEQWKDARKATAKAWVTTRRQSREVSRRYGIN